MVSLSNILNDWICFSFELEVSAHVMDFNERQKEELCCIYAIVEDCGSSYMNSQS